MHSYLEALLLVLLKLTNALTFSSFCLCVRRHIELRSCLFSLILLFLFWTSSAIFIEWADPPSYSFAIIWKTCKKKIEGLAEVSLCDFIWNFPNRNLYNGIISVCYGDRLAEIWIRDGGRFSIIIATYRDMRISHFSHSNTVFQANVTFKLTGGRRGLKECTHKCNYLYVLFMQLTGEL